MVADQSAINVVGNVKETEPKECVAPEISSLLGWKPCDRAQPSMSGSISVIGDPLDLRTRSLHSLRSSPEDRAHRFRPRAGESACERLGGSVRPAFPHHECCRDHVMVVLFENRSLDNLLGRLYGPEDGKTFEGDASP